MTFRRLTAAISTVTRSVRTMKKETEAMTASARRANDAIAKNDALVAKIRDSNHMGHLINQYLELLEFTKKNPFRDQTGIMKMEQLIQRFVGGSNRINFNLLRSGNTRLKSTGQDSGMSGDYLAMLKKMGILK